MMPFDQPPKLWLPSKPAIIRPETARPLPLRREMGTFPFPTFVPAAAPSVVEISLTDSVQDPANLTEYTFASRAFGAAAADRILAVPVSYSNTSGASIASVSIGGVGATVVQCGGTNYDAAVAYAFVPIGATGNVVVTGTAVSVGCSIAIYRIVGANPTVHDLDSPAGGADGSRSITIDVPARGGVIAAAAIDNAVGAYTAGGVTEQELGLLSGAFRTTASLLSGLTITHSFSRCICGVSWAPAS